MNDIKLVAIINSLNRLTLLKLGLTSLVKVLQSLPISTAIVIFDAGSTDGSLTWLQELIQSDLKIPIDIITPDASQDRSFSAGVNQACDFAKNKYLEIEWYFLFETDNWINDEEPLQTAILLLEKYPDLAAAGFTVKKHSGEDVGYGCNFPTLGEFLIGQQLTHSFQFDAPKNDSWQAIANSWWSTCNVVFTSPILVRRTAWEQSHGMDSVTFPFSECDMDWAWRLAKLGWKMAVIKTSKVIHDNQERLSNWSSLRVVHFHKARLQLLHRHVGEWIYGFIPLLFIRHVLELLVLLIFWFQFPYPQKSLHKRWILLTTVFNQYKTT